MNQLIQSVTIGRASDSSILVCRSPLVWLRTYAYVYQCL